MTDDDQKSEVVVVATDPKSGPIIFYCKDCEEVVETERCGRKYVYTCKKCGTKNVAFGTKKSIYGFFRLEEKEEEIPQEDEKVQRGSVV